MLGYICQHVWISVHVDVPLASPKVRYVCMYEPFRPLYKYINVYVYYKYMNVYVYYKLNMYVYYKYMNVYVYYKYMNVYVCYKCTSLPIDRVHWILCGDFTNSDGD